MLFDRNIVEKDLERIRTANLTPEQLEAREPEEKRIYEECRPEPLDILAMIIAAISVIVPYVLVFVCIMTVFALLFSN